MTGSATPAPRKTFDAILGCCVFAVALLLQIAGSFAATDEAWFVQVLRRVLSGEVLYRDVAFGINPLSVYIAAPFAWIFGSELLVMKTLQSAAFAATVLVSLRIIRRLGVHSTLVEIAVAVAMIACAPAGSTISFYTPLATLFGICALDEALRWCCDGASDRAARAARAGMWIGLAFAAKQNTGVFMFFAYAAAVSLVGRSNAMIPLADRWQAFRRASLAAAIVVGVVLFPVVVTGAFPAFIDYAYLGKSSYVNVAGLNPLTTLAEWWTGLEASGTFAGLRDFLSLQAAILPVLVLGGLAAASPRWWRSDRDRTIVVLLFTVASFATLFPRADSAHLAGAVPVLVIALAHMAKIVSEQVSRRTAIAVGTALFAVWIGGAASRIASSMSRFVSPEHRTSRLRGIRGVLGPIAYLDGIERDASALDELAGNDGATFLLSPRAGLFSVIGNRRNPTPYDYPFVTTFGAAGEGGLIAMLDDGRIRRVCVDRSGNEAGVLWPSRFEAEVVRRFQEVGSNATWVLYEAREEK